MVLAKVESSERGRHRVRRPKRRSPKLESFKKIVDEWLVADLDAPRKQRHSTRYRDFSPFGWKMWLFRSIPDA
jgi:hypothetical protein